MNVILKLPMHFMPTAVNVSIIGNFYFPLQISDYSYTYNIAGIELEEEWS